MKVVFTDDALRDIDDILRFISENYPIVARPFDNRLHAIVTRIGSWPDSAQEVTDRPGVRSVPFIRYPYRLFYLYRVVPGRVEVLHVHHSSRDEDPTGRGRSSQ